MEMRGRFLKIHGSVLLRVVLALLVLHAAMTSWAQPQKKYTIRDGKMIIALAKQISLASLDSFISQYDLQDLALKEFMRNGFPDSLRNQGWHVELNNNLELILSKPLFGFEKFINPADKIIFTGKEPNPEFLFPSANVAVMVGFNRFRNKLPFRVEDSVVTFYLREHRGAKRVMLAGSFNDWDPQVLAMRQTDSGWIARVKLKPGKHWYKFIVDGNWTVDKDNVNNENDGRGNINSVFYQVNHVMRLEGYQSAKKVFLAGSFNNWSSDDLPMIRRNGGWELPIFLAQGTHYYRFVADGKWFEDPANPDRIPNEFGQHNSVIRKGLPQKFFLEGYPNAKQVILAGSFNQWRTNELSMKKTQKGWELEYTLGPGNHEYNFVVDGKWIVRSQSNNDMSNQFVVIEPNFTFRLKGFENAKQVYLSGDFNNWSPNTFAMQKQGNEWVLTMHLPPGKHLYKYVVDGKWIIDPANDLWEQNEYGTGNSVVWMESSQ